ncbi:hypothetical protein GCM10027047_16320 [Rhodococcus aerolatus]
MSLVVLGLAATALLVVPGVIVGLAARLPVTVALVCSPALTLGPVGIGTVTLGVLGVRWAWWSALAVLAVTVALAAALAVPLTRRWGPDRAAGGGPRGAVEVGVPAAGIALGAAAALITMLRRLSLHDVPQQWDAQWHANTIRFIAETGTASPLDLGLLRNQESRAPLFYPDAVHALAAFLEPLSGYDTVAVYNTLIVVLPALLLPVSAAALAWWVVRGRRPAREAAWVAAAAAALSASFTAVPYLEVWVQAMPSLLATALAVPTALLVSSCPARPSRVPVAVLALVGLFSLHPSGAFVAAALVGARWAAGQLWRPVRGRLRDLAALASVAVLTVLALLPQVGGVLSQQADITVQTFPEQTTLTQAMGDAVLQRTRHLLELGPQWPLLGLAAVGLLVALALRAWWFVLAWVGFVVLCVSAIHPAPFRGALLPLTGVFYNDPRRITSVITLLLPVMAGLAVVAAVLVVARAAGWAVRRAPGRADGTTLRRGLVAAGVLAGLVLAVGLAAGYAPRNAEMADRARDGRLISPADQAMFTVLAGLPGAQDGTVLNQPYDGLGWAYAITGVRTQIRHYYEPTYGPEQRVLLDAVDRAGEDRAVDDALRALDVRYVIVSTPLYDPRQAPPPGFADLDAAPGLSKVYDNGEARIYAVRATAPPT